MQDRDLVVFLGSGFSAPAGVPVTHSLFDEDLRVDRVSRHHLVQRVRKNWLSWRARNEGGPEQFLSHLSERFPQDFHEARWFIALAIALRMGRVQSVGPRLELTSDLLAQAPAYGGHEDFWDVILQHALRPAVVTTNYDILAERGLRLKPISRPSRPGFVYENGPMTLAGRGFPVHGTNPYQLEVRGSVPILKLHGSVSWASEGGSIVRYHDCRPAVRGDPAIIAPTESKGVPTPFRPIWAAAEAALRNASKWIFVGYSLPAYDTLIRALLGRSGPSVRDVFVLDPAPSVAGRFAELLPHSKVHALDGIPAGTSALRRALDVPT